MYDRKKLLVIIGSTSTGKTDLALQLAKKFNGELISADSRQVYKNLDIGTGKYPSSKFKVQSSKLEKADGFWKIAGIKIWMYDIVSPQRQYTVADYVKNAARVIKDIQTRGKRPFIVGGTGLYIRALTDGLSNLAIPMDKKLRQELENLSLAVLQRKLQQLSTDRWERMNNSDRQNPRRLIRAIEISQSVHIKPTAVKLMSTDILKIGLTAGRKILYEKSDKRMISRIKQGMIEEAEKLKKEGLGLKRMRELGLEYGVLADFLEGKIKTKEEFAKILQNKIHGFIRRQLTWFKKEKNIYWFDITNKNYSAKVENLISKWYDSAINYAQKN